MVLRTRRVSFLLGMLFVLLMGATLYIGLWAAPLFRKDELMVVQRRLDLNRILQGDPGMFWTNRPNLKGELFESQSEGCGNAFRVTTNALGMRGPATGEKGGRLRILAIGDSTTFGQYLEDHETWPAVLQSLLDAEGARAEVLNAGVIGMSSFQGLAYLMARGFDLQPDVVIATFGFNDRSPWDLRDREIAPPLWKEPRGRAAAEDAARHERAREAIPGCDPDRCDPRRVSGHSYRHGQNLLRAGGAPLPQPLAGAGTGRGERCG